jgi:hypothetical protein
MITKTLDISIKDSYKEAPQHYEDYTPVLIKKCIIVGKGTEAGKPTVDIQLIDDDGNKYIAFTTGAILESLGAAITGKRERDEAGG